MLRYIIKDVFTVLPVILHALLLPYTRAGEISLGSFPVLVKILTIPYLLDGDCVYMYILLLWVHASDETTENVVMECVAQRSLGRRNSVVSFV